MIRCRTHRRSAGSADPPRARRRRRTRGTGRSSSEALPPARSFALLTVAPARHVGYNISAMAISEQLKQTVGKALGRVPSGVFILTAAHNGESAAMMASWVQQAAFDPPAVSIAMAK